MNSTTKRRLALPALALAGALALTACAGDSADTAAPGTSSSASDGHGSAHSTDGGSDSAKGNDADVAFLAGMVPHHTQAVEMSEIILSKNPPAEVAAIAAKIKDAQAPEIEQMTSMLTDLGESTDPAAHSEHGAGHGGMMTEEELAELEDASGTDASTMFLELMIAHHEGAIEASDTQIADGQYAPAVDLAKKIKQEQAAEITEMTALLQTL